MQQSSKTSRLPQENEAKQSIKSSKYSQRSYADEADESGTSETLELNSHSNRNLECYLPEQRDSNLRNSAATRSRKS